MTKRLNIPFSPPDISDLEVEEVAEALKSGWITTGPRVERLKKLLAVRMVYRLVYKKLGFKEVSREERFNSHDELIYLSNGNVFLRLYKDSTHPKRDRNPRELGIEISRV